MQVIETALFYDPRSLPARQRAIGARTYSSQHHMAITVNDTTQRSSSQIEFHRYEGALIVSSTPVLVKEAMKHWRHITNMQAHRHIPKKIDTVCTDDEAAGELAARHLMEQGADAGAFVFFDTRRFTPFRQKGFYNGLKQTNLKPVYPPELTYRPDGSVNHDEIWKEFGTWLSRQTGRLGIFTSNDYDAEYIMKICRHLNLNIPGDIMVLGCGNDDLIVSGTYIPLSSIDLDFFQVGYRAAQHLDGRIRGTVKGPRSRTKIRPLRVITRQSTDPTAVENSLMAEAMTWIKRHACRGGNVNMLAEEMPVSRRTLETQFANHFHCSPHEAIVRQRIQRALTMLRETGLNLHEVASISGFSSAQYFSNVFKEHTGMTPAEYQLKRND